jgi:hypothetical protein
MERIPIEKIDEILQGTTYIKMDEYQESHSNFLEYYLLSGGKFVIVSKRAGFGFVFDSEKQFIDLKGPGQYDKPTHILEGYDIYRNDEVFFKTSKQSHLKLSELLGIPVNLLNFTFESLKLIDEKIKEQKISVKEYIEKLFPVVVQYIGETIIHEKQGQWHLIFDQECEVWEPFVELTDKRMVNIFLDHYDFAVEHYADFTVYGAAFFRLKGFKLGGRFKF